MNLDDYKALAVRTAKWLPTKAQDQHHAALGAVTEVGELATIVKRVTIYNKDLTLEMADNVREEVGDVMWYLALYAHVRDFKLDTLQETTGEPSELESATEAIEFLSLGAAVMWDLDDGDLVYRAMNVHAMMHALRYLCVWAGVSFDQALVENIDKLRKRFPDAYTDQAAEARADKNGLDARNS